ncbi:hypothetical protein CLAIMM_13205 [Cladophialophora immunda]|nr:hypothetical protein CLAIMM_13205 [Cladophialophora immunda]
MVGAPTTGAKRTKEVGKNLHCHYSLPPSTPFHFPLYNPGSPITPSTLDGEGTEHKDTDTGIHDKSKMAAEGGRVCTQNLATSSVLHPGQDSFGLDSDARS